MEIRKHYDEPSVFTPENLLREARRQKGLKNCHVPEICVLDPDGDLVSYLVKNKQATLNNCWAGYHTKLYTVKYENAEFGIIGCGVGASFAVLIAEQLFVSGCRILISITSAGMINTTKKESEFILIHRAIRDEGTSYHYLRPGEISEINSDLSAHLMTHFRAVSYPIETGNSWTTDAPYRETQAAIDEAREADIACVEMEAAALYAFAKAKNKQIICFAHLTNTMAQTNGDFEKGEEMGSLTTLTLIHHTIDALRNDMSYHWNNIYSTKQPVEVSWTQEVPATSLELIHSFGLPKTAAIIDVGGGDSKLVDFLLDKGYENLTVLDISNRAIKRAKKRLGKRAEIVNWIVSDITTFNPTVRYDIWHDRATFHFLTTGSQIEKYVGIAQRAVGKYMVIGTFSKKGPKKCSGLDVKQYDEDTLRATFEPGFDKLECKTEDHLTPFGTQQNFLFCCFKRRVSQ